MGKFWLGLLCRFYYLLKPANQELGAKLYAYCELTHILVWVVLAASMLFTAGKSFTFDLGNSNSHGIVLTGCLGVSLAIKLLICLALLLNYRSWHSQLFVLVTLSVSSLAIFDAAANNELWVLASTQPETIKTVVQIGCFLNFGLNFLIRIFSQLTNSNYLFSNRSPEKRLPHLWTTTICYLLIVAFFVQTNHQDSVGKIGGVLICVLWLLLVTVYMKRLPFLSVQAINLKIVWFTVSFAMMLVAVLLKLSFFQGNLPILYVLVICFAGAFGFNYYVHQTNTLILCRLDEISDPSIAVTRLHHLAAALLDEPGNPKCLSTVMVDHQALCRDPSCTCRTQFPTSSNPLKIQDLTFNPQSSPKTYCKYFLISESQLCRQNFPEQSPIELSYLSALAVTGLYTRLFSEALCFESTTNAELCLSQQLQLSILRGDSAAEIQAGPGSSKHMNIELYGQYEQLMQRIELLITEIISNKAKVWRNLKSSLQDYSQFKEMLKMDVDLTIEIEALYKEMTDRGIESLRLWDLLLNYSKFVIQNSKLAEDIRKKYTQCAIYRSTGGAQTSSSDLSQYFSAERCASLRVSIDKNSLGRIDWHSKNLYMLYGAPNPSWSAIGQNVSMFLPTSFQSDHITALQGWYNCPVSSLLQQVNHFMIETHGRMVKDIDLHLRILPLEIGFQVYVLLDVLPKGVGYEYIILNEDLQIVNHPDCLRWLLKETGLSYSQINFGLLSQQFVDLDWGDINKTPTRMEFSLCYADTYNQLRRQYNDIAHQIKKMPKCQQALKGLRQYYISQIHYDLKYEKTRSISAQVRKVCWPTGKQFLAIRTNTEQKSGRSSNAQPVHISGSIIQSVKASQDSFLDEQDNEFADEGRQSEASVASQFSLNKNSIRKIKNVLLPKLTCSFGLLMLVFCLIFIIQIALTTVLLAAYQQNLNRDSNVSDVMQLSEFVYDYTLLTRQQFLKGKVFQPEHLKSLNAYVTDYVLKHLADDQALNTALPSFIPQISYLEQPILLMMQAERQMVSIREFLQTFLGAARSIYIDLEQAAKSGRKVMSSKAQSLWNVMVDNYPQLAWMNQHILDQFELNGKAILSQLQTACIVLLPCNFLCSVSVVWLLIVYQRRRQQSEFQLIQLFSTIDVDRLEDYASYYEKIKSTKNLSGCESMNSSNTSYSLRRNTYIGVPEHRVGWRHLAMLCLLVACEIFCSGSTLQFKVNSFRELTQMNALLQSQNYQIQALIELNELSTGADSMGSTRFRHASDKINTPQVQFTIDAYSLLQSRLPQNIQAFEYSIVSDICMLAKDVFTEEQYHLCQTPEFNISENGLMATMTYCQRTLQQYYTSLQQGTPIRHQLGLLDPLYFLQFRIYQLTQNEIMRQCNYFATTLLANLNAAYISNVVGLVIALGFFWRFYKNERETTKREYGYLMIFPAKQLKTNKHILRYVTRLNYLSLV